DLRRAEAILTDACERMEAAKGESDIASIRLRRTLSSCLFLQTRFDDVIKLDRMILERAINNPDIGDDALLTAGIRGRLAGILTRSTDPAELAEAEVLCGQAAATLQRQAQREPRLSKELKYELLQSKFLQYRVSHLHRDDPKFARDYKELVDQAVPQYEAGDEEEVVKDYDGLAIASLEAGVLDIAHDSIKKLKELAPKVFGGRSPFIRRYDAMWGEYLVQMQQFDQAEQVLNDVLSAEGTNDDNSFVSSWDSFFLIRAYCQYGICLRQRNEDVLARQYLEKAMRILDQRVAQMGTFQNRHMVQERYLILKQLQGVYADLGEAERAADTQQTIIELQQILDRVL
ncbi:MAG: hypothetical protein KDB23_31505, partial [Planctomycetales bacterium]|nr:hypothetical protein [Planctomycetales bacterium]